MTPVQHHSTYFTFHILIIFEVCSLIGATLNKFQRRCKKTFVKI